ncbi:DUF5324 family protein [Yinghuangia seranimata]|uniref:DUF5324 family protein n=1 Tax=Yinghuangia seranimata TaxID=408067 RepID=UPI00248BD808|nr:DUF5324 family protein [Yinghuangia seranimata]MDI2132861.1 DUF5324 family protein [Yinghuangia seranimata]
MDQARDARDRVVVWIAPRAMNAREAAVHYAGDARAWAAPRLEQALADARVQAQDRVLPALDAARLRMTAYGRDTVAPALGPRVESAVDAAKHRVQDDLVPAVNHAAVAAREASEPMLMEARSRAEAAAMALRGEVTAAEMNKIVKAKKHKRRRRSFALVTALAIGACLGWVMWQRRVEEAEWKADDTATEPAPGQADAYRGEPVTDPGSVTEDPGEEELHGAGAKGKHRNRRG